MDNDISYFSYLPDDAIITIALQLDINELSYHCLYNSKFNDVVCDNNWFWKQKFLHDFGLPEYDSVDDWKALYKNYGSVYVFGKNQFGQLGLNNNGKTVSIPTKIPNLNVKAIAVGSNHTVAINFYDDILVFGGNAEYQLGLGDKIDRFVPTKIPGFKVKSISAGLFHTVAIDLNDDVWAFGDNRYGELGLGDRYPRARPTKIIRGLNNSNPLKAKFIDAGNFSTMIIDFDGCLWSCGANKYGNLGVGGGEKILTPRKVFFSASNLPDFKVKFVSAGEDHTVVLDFYDNVWVFGGNSNGQLGLGDKKDRFKPKQIPNFKAKSVVAGNFSTVALDFNDEVWTFGYNYDGQLGLNDTTDRLRPTKIDSKAFGKPNFKAKSIFAGDSRTMVIDLDDEVWEFGDSGIQKLGSENKPRQILTPEKIPKFKAKYIAIGYSHTVAISDYNF
jgi:alpha-tubulin suppressor-like RCC1 family protein